MTQHNLFSQTNGEYLLNRGGLVFIKGYSSPGIITHPRREGER